MSLYDTPAYDLTRQLLSTSPDLAEVRRLLDTIGDINQPLPPSQVGVKPLSWRPQSAMTHYVVSRTTPAPDPAAIHLACLNGHAEVLAELISRGAHLSPHSKLGTPLRTAARLNESICCQLLLEAGVNPNERDANGATALHHLCKDLLQSVLSIRNDNPSPTILVHLLLAHGINPNITSADLTALDYCSMQSGNHPALTHHIGSALIAAGAHMPASICDGTAERASQHVPPHLITSNSLRAHMIATRHRALHLLDQLQHPSQPIPVFRLTAADICLLANIGAHHQIAHAALWEGHHHALANLLTSLPPWLSTDLITHSPDLLLLASSGLPSPRLNAVASCEPLAPAPHTRKPV